MIRSFLILEARSAMVMVPDVIIGRRLTFEDYLALPDDQDYEIIDGALYGAPRARPRHQVIANNLCFDLTNFVRNFAVGVVMPDADLIVTASDTYVSPDIMYFTLQHYAAIDRDDFVRTTPDLVVEVVSPTREGYDRVTKRRTYERLGVRHYWVFDPQPGIVAEHVLQSDGVYSERIYGPGGEFRPSLFPDLLIQLEIIFS